MLDVDYYVFDFDGVILDSNQIKTSAFRWALEGEPTDRIDMLVAYHLRHGGVSRHQKIDYYINHISRDPRNVSRSRILSRFAEYCKANLPKAKLVPGVTDFLQLIEGSGRPCFVVSGGSEDEILQLCSERGIARHFASIRGNPTPKAILMDELMAVVGKKLTGRYFGDAELDMLLAEQHGLVFTLVAGSSDWPEGRATASARGHSVIESFTDMALPRLGHASTTA